MKSGVSTPTVIASTLNRYLHSTLPVLLHHTPSGKGVKHVADKLTNCLDLLLQIYSIS